MGQHDLFITGARKENKNISIGIKNTFFFDLVTELKGLKIDEHWLKSVNSQSLQMSLRNLDNVYTRFFREKKGFPKFKSKHNLKQSFQCPQHCSVNWKEGTLTVPKIKNIKTELHRKFEGTIKIVTISRSATGKYYVSILVENDISLPKKSELNPKNAVGIDVGLSRFLTTSEGMIVENPRYFKKSEKRLAYQQYKLSKMKKALLVELSKRKRIARVHEHVSNQRRDFFCIR